MVSRGHDVVPIAPFSTAVLQICLRLVEQLAKLRTPVQPRLGLAGGGHVVRERQCCFLVVRAQIHRDCNVVTSRHVDLIKRRSIGKLYEDLDHAGDVVCRARGASIPVKCSAGAQFGQAQSAGISIRLNRTPAIPAACSTSSRMRGSLSR